MSISCSKFGWHIHNELSLSVSKSAGFDPERLKTEMDGKTKFGEFALSFLRILPEWLIQVDKGKAVREGTKCGSERLRSAPGAQPRSGHSSLAGAIDLVLVNGAVSGVATISLDSLEGTCEATTPALWFTVYIHSNLSFTLI